MTRTAFRTLLIERGGLLCLTTLLVYVWLAPHHVVDGDNAEFATLSVTGGAAHPSGYPLYVLWLRVWSWLPLGEPVHVAAVTTAMLGALGVLALHAAARAWGARPLSATCAVVIFATGPVVLRVVTEAEVFALNNLIVALVLWLAAKHGPVQGARRAALLGLVAGLGLADHLTCVLVAPVGLLGVVRAAGELSVRPAWARALALACAGLVVGLVPYAYLVAAPDTPMSWGTVRSVDDLVGMVLRRDYGGPTAYRAAGSDVSVWSNELALARTLGRAWLWIPAVLGLGALAWSAARTRDPEREPRAGWQSLALSWLVAGPLFVVRFNAPAGDIGAYVNQRFHLLPAVLLVVAVARAFDRIRLPAREALVNTLIATVGVVALAAPSLDYVGRVHSPAVELSARNMLRTLPERAVVIHAQDELHAVPGYVQWATGERQDVTIVTWPLISLGWYRARLAARGVAFDPATMSEATLVRDVLATGRSVFIDRFQRSIIEQFPTYPYGILIRVLPRGTAIPSLREVFDLNQRLYAEFALAYARPGPHDEFATEVHRRYSAAWEMIGKMLDRSGDHVLAARAFEHQRTLAPAD